MERSREVRTSWMGPKVDRRSCAKLFANEASPRSFFRSNSAQTVTNAAVNLFSGSRKPADNYLLNSKLFYIGGLFFHRLQNAAEKLFSGIRNSLTLQRNVSAAFGSRCKTFLQLSNAAEYFLGHSEWFQTNSNPKNGHWGAQFANNIAHARLLTLGTISAALASQEL